MGAQQSRSSGSAGSDGCPCFVLSPPFKVDKENDLLGSPIPDTPRVPQDRRSSKYIGLEKELEASKRDLKSSNKRIKTRDTLDIAESQNQAQIHEGSVRELRFFCFGHAQCCD
jgi:hypothetical protein